MSGRRCDPGGSARSTSGRRLRGERGTAFVTAMVVMFVVTGSAALYLARDVNQRVSDRSTMQSIAFQSARAGAQQVDIGGLRGVEETMVVIDVVAAERATRSTAARLAAEYGVQIDIERQFADESLRTWTVELSAVDGTLRARGVARVATGG